MLLTWILCGAQSIAAALVKLTTAPLLAQYEAVFSVPVMPRIEAVLMIQLQSDGCKGQRISKLQAVPLRHVPSIATWMRILLNHLL